MGHLCLLYWNIWTNWRILLTINWIIFLGQPTKKTNWQIKNQNIWWYIFIILFLLQLHFCVYISCNFVATCWVDATNVALLNKCNSAKPNQLIQKAFLHNFLTSSVIMLYWFYMITVFADTSHEREHFNLMSTNSLYNIK